MAVSFTPPARERTRAFQSRAFVVSSAVTIVHLVSRTAIWIPKQLRSNCDGELLFNRNTVNEDVQRYGAAWWHTYRHLHIDLDQPSGRTGIENWRIVPVIFLPAIDFRECDDLV